MPGPRPRVRKSDRPRDLRNRRGGKDLRRDLGGRRARRVLRRQAARRPAGGDTRREAPMDRGLPLPPARAGGAGGQDDSRRPLRDRRGLDHARAASSSHPRARRAAGRGASVAGRDRSRSLPRGISAEAIDTRSLFGGGTTPERTFPSAGLALSSSSISADELARRLRAGKPPVVGRVERGRVILDFRTIFPKRTKSSSQRSGGSQ